MISNTLQDREILCGLFYDVDRCCTAPARFYYHFSADPGSPGYIEARCSAHRIATSNQVRSITEAEFLIRSVMEC